MSQSQFSIQAFVFIFILIIYVLAAHFIDIRKITFLHQSTIAILMGFITALIVYYVHIYYLSQSKLFSQTMDKQIQFNNDIFFTIILPPIIFSAGYSLRKSLFFQNFGMISFLGVVGTVICFSCLGLGIRVLDKLFFDKLSMKQVLMLSSVLCATDTVAAMSLIKPEKFPVLNAVLFGEGIINDAVAIILFRTVEKLQFDQSGMFTFQLVLKMIFDFLLLFICSLVIGMAAGFGISYLLKVNDSFTRSPIKQSSLILLTGYVTYLLGQLLGFSGIITLFTCAIIMGHYTFMNISQQSQRGTGLAFQTVSYVAEAFIYAYLGATILSVSGSWSAIFFALILILIFPFIRGIMVYILPGIYKITGRQFPLKSNQLKICWYSGLVRGVIAFALSLQIQSINVHFVQTVSMVIVMVTTIFGSSLLKSFMKCIRMDEYQQSEEINPTNMQKKFIIILSNSVKINDRLLLQSQYHKSELQNNNLYKIGSSSSTYNQNDEKNKQMTFKKRFQQFQQNYVVPLFKKNKNQNFSYQMTTTNDKVLNSQKKIKEQI